jgi:hypothetical protein
MRLKRIYCVKWRQSCSPPPPSLATHGRQPTRRLRRSFVVCTSCLCRTLCSTFPLNLTTKRPFKMHVFCRLLPVAPTNIPPPDGNIYICTPHTFKSINPTAQLFYILDRGPKTKWRWCGSHLRSSRICHILLMITGF